MSHGVTDSSMPPSTRMTRGETGALPGGSVRLARVSQATKNLGAASQTRATSRPARITVKSGRTSAAAALPSASHWYRGEPGCTSSTSVPRSASPARCWGESGTPVTSTNPPRVDVVVPVAVRQERVGAQPSVEGLAGSALLHEGGRVQRWCLAVEETVAQAGNPVQPGGDGPAEEVPGLATSGHRDADELGELDERPGMRFALHLIGVEHGLGEVTGEHTGDLPAEVHGVADAGAEPLSDEGWGQVGGVAEEEDVAVAPVVGQLRAEVVLRDAHELQLVARDPLDPGSDQGLEGFDGLEVGGGLALRRRNSQR